MCTTELHMLYYYTVDVPTYTVPDMIRELPVQHEVNNIHDDFAVAVLKNSNAVGHVPRFAKHSIYKLLPSLCLY